MTNGTNCNLYLYHIIFYITLRIQMAPVKYPEDQNIYRFHIYLLLFVYENVIKVNTLSNQVIVTMKMMPTFH